MKLKAILKYSTLFTLTFATFIAGLLVFNHFENKKTLNSVYNDQAIYNEKIIEFKKSVDEKISYTLSLSGNSSQAKELKILASAMQSLALKGQDDFDRFELIYAKFNQKIAENAVLLNESKKSLFPTEKHLRSMEVFDLNIDKKREDASKLAFQINQRLSSLKYDPLKNDLFLKTPIFKIDQLIFSSK